MDKFIILSIFILVLLLPTVIFSMIIKSVPKLKMRDSAPYLDKISTIKDCVNVHPAGEEDVEKIKRRIQHGIGIITLTILIDILAIIGLINIARVERVAAGYIAVYIAVLAALSAVCLYKGIKHMQVFRTIQKNDKWSVVMHQGRPAGIIKG